MKEDRHITWDNFSNFYLRDVVPSICPIKGDPPIEFFFSPQPERLGVRVHAGDIDEDLPENFTEINIERRVYKSEKIIEVFIQNRKFFRHFFHIVQEVADRIQLANEDPVTSITSAFRNLRLMIKEKRRLSVEKEIGLWGELHVLDAISNVIGPECISCWTGPSSEKHDFRISSLELEVKTTTNDRRVHYIHGLSQLVPSMACKLNLVSIQLVRSGFQQGASLAEKVRVVRAKFEKSPDLVETFDSLIEKAGYLSEDASSYGTSWGLRSESLVFQVDEGFPRFTRDELEMVLTPEKASRLSDFGYRIDVTGIEGTVFSEELISTLCVEKLINE